MAAELDPLYREIRRDLNAARLVNGDTTGWFVNGKGWYVWVFVGKDAGGKETVLFEIEDSAGKRVPMGVLGQFEGIVGSDSGRILEPCRQDTPKVPAPLLPGHVPHDRKERQQRV